MRLVLTVLVKQRHLFSSKTVEVSKTLRYEHQNLRAAESELYSCAHEDWHVLTCIGTPSSEKF